MLPFPPSLLPNRRRFQLSTPFTLSTPVAYDGSLNFPPPWPDLGKPEIVSTHRKGSNSAWSKEAEARLILAATDKRNERVLKMACQLENWIGSAYPLSFQDAP
jgi:hypothetical protein